MKLKDMRKEKRLTQCQLAEYVGVSQAYICALESGRRTNPSLDIIKKIAAALGVQTAKVLEALDSIC